jgi:hypothetical protein
MNEPCPTRRGELGCRSLATRPDEDRRTASRSARQEVRHLKERFAPTLGDEVATAHPEHSVPATAVNDL